MFIDPAKPIRWRVVRTWPSLVCPASPTLLYEYLEIWRGTYWPDTCIQDDYIWHDGYVEGAKYEPRATIFDTIEEAQTAALVMEQRWPGCKFMLEVYQK